MRREKAASFSSPSRCTAKWKNSSISPRSSSSASRSSCWSGCAAVLGTRTGNERAPLQRVKTETPATDDTVVPLRPRAGATPEPVQNADAERQQRRLATEIEQFSHGDAAVAAGLKAINEADPDVCAQELHRGRQGCLRDDRHGVCPGRPQDAQEPPRKGRLRRVRARASTTARRPGNKVDFTFVGLPKVEITEAEVDKRQAQVTVRFNAEVVSATRDKAGDAARGQRRPGAADHRRMGVCAQSEIARSQLEARRHQPGKLTQSRSDRRRRWSSAVAKLTCPISTSGQKSPAA